MPNVTTSNHVTTTTPYTGNDSHRKPPGRRRYRWHIQTLVWVLCLVASGIFVFGGQPIAYADGCPGDMNGNGTEGDPCIILTADQLDAVRIGLDRNYRLGADIDLGIPKYSDGAGWEPIGTRDEPFTGSLDGAGYTISNLTIDRSTRDNGLFGVIIGSAAIEHLYLENVSISAKGSEGINNGALVGRSLGLTSPRIVGVHAAGSVSGYAETGGLIGWQAGDEGVIAHSSFQGTVIGGHSWIGGLAGSNSGLIEHSFAAADVQAPAYVGGLVGRAGEASHIRHAYATGNVRATSNSSPRIGGLVGRNGVTSIIEYAYATGDVNSAGAMAGGLVGENFGVVRYTYATGKVDGPAEAGGLVGRNNHDGIHSLGNVTFSYWDTDSTGKDNDEGVGTNDDEGIFEATGRETVELMDPDAFDEGIGWDFATIWDIVPGETYPFLRSTASFAAVTFSEGELDPAFHPATTAYAISASANSLRIDVQASHPESVVTVDGHNHDGSGGETIVLDRNVIDAELTVTTEMFGHPITYTYQLVIERVVPIGTDLAVLVVHQGVLVPRFDPGTTTYQLDVAATVNELEISAQAAAADATVTIAGQSVGEGGSHTVPLAYGENVIEVVVARNEDPTLKQTYTLTVTRALPGANLAALVVDQGVLEPAFDPGVTAYQVTVAATVSELEISAQAAESDVTVTIAGQSVGEGGSHTVPLAFGENPIEVSIATVADPDVSKTYDLIVVRLSPCPAEMAGAGMSDNPCLILDADDLDAVHDELSLHYRLAANIDLDGFGADDGWEPIGTSAEPFTGSLDGAGHTIRKLFIPAKGISTGLFGVLGGEAEIKNLRLVDVDVTAGFFDSSGALAGQVLPGSTVNITGVHASGVVTGGFFDTGGLIGLQEGEGSRITHSSFIGSVEGHFGQLGGLVGTNAGLVEHSFAAATVTGPGAFYVGGLVGSAESDSEIRYSYATGAVTALFEGGGLVGYNASGSIIEHSFATGDVIGADEDMDSYLGGLVGTNDGTIRTTYAAGAVTADYPGGLVGLNEPKGEISFSYWDVESSGEDDGFGDDKGSFDASGETTAAMMAADTFAGPGWDFDTVWDIIAGETYPFFRFSASLVSLTVGDDELVPVFAPATFAYHVDVPAATTTVDITAQAWHPASVVTIAGSVHDDGGGGTESVDLAYGSNEIDIKVATEIFADQEISYTYRLTVKREMPSSSGGPSSPPVKNESPVTEPTDDGRVLHVDPAMLETETRDDGAVIEVVKVDEEILDQALEELIDSGKPTFTVRVDDQAAGVRLTLPASFILDFGQAIEEAVIDLRLNGASYQFAVHVLDLATIAEQMGVTIEDLTFHLIIEKASDEVVEAIDQLASEQGVTPASDVIDFKIIVAAAGQSVEIGEFGGTYMPRSIVAEGSPENQTGVMYNPVTHTFSFVPSFFNAQPDGTMEMVMFSPHNSLYLVIETGNKTFSDIQRHWAQEDIEFLASRLIIQGVSATQFAPNVTITRAESTALLVRSLGLAVGDDRTRSRFADVDANAWYAPVIKVAVAVGLVQGIDEDHFAPNAPITREQMAVMIANAMKLAGKRVINIDGNKALEMYTDQDQISAWAKHAVFQSVTAVIINGYPDHTIAPKQIVTRAEAAAMMKRLLQAVEFIN